VKIGWFVFINWCLDNKAFRRLAKQKMIVFSWSITMIGHTLIVIG
jgi:hypothetical protein